MSVFQGPGVVVEGLVGLVLLLGQRVGVPGIALSGMVRCPLLGFYLHVVQL